MFNPNASPEYALIRPDIVQALNDYGQHHHGVGDFLVACLKNQFHEAVCRADHTNRHTLPEIAKYMYNELPSQCWGSPEKVTAWLNGSSNKEYEKK